MEDLKTVVTLDSECYGPYDYHWIGLIDLVTAVRTYGVDTLIEWDDDYHPMFYFSGKRCGGISIKKTDTDGIFHLYLPIEELNRKLPVTVKLKEVKKWFEKSKFVFKEYNEELLK